MHNFKKSIFFLISLFLFSTCFAQDQGFTIKNYDIKINYDNSGYAMINEVITADFTQSKHGIIRAIPLEYTVDNTPFVIYVDNVNVDGDQFSQYQEGSDYKIRIGSPDSTVIGPKTYNINYRIYGLIKKFSGYQELYQNIIGDKRDVQIDKMSFTLQFPGGVVLSSGDRSLLHGNYGEKNNFKFDSKIEVNTFSSVSNSYLNPNEAVTILMKFAPGSFSLDDSMQESLLNYTLDTTSSITDVQFTSFSSDSLNSQSLLVLLFEALFTYLIIWVINKRNKAANRISSKDYPIYYTLPKGLDSAEVGCLIDSSMQHRDITAMIYEWAVNGYIKIKEEMTKFLWIKSYTYTLTKLKDIPQDAKPYQKHFFDEMFKHKETFTISTAASKKLTIIVNSTEKKLNSYIKEQERFTVINLEYNNIQTHGIFTFVIAVSLSYLMFILFMFLVGMFIDSGLSSWVLLGYFIADFVIIISLFSIKNKEILTEKGRELAKQIRGYKLFLQKVERPQLEFFLKEDPMFFDKVLPFAIVLGVETRFIQQIEPLLKEMPTRYEGSSMTARNISNLSNSINQINTASSYVAHSSYSSSGGFSSGSGSSSGGSSGGGGGGGGGSSW